MPNSYPEPLVVPPRSGQHRQSFIVLHGRGLNGELFGRELLQTPFPDLGTLQEVFPDARFIFPTAAKRRAQIYNRTSINQWFDNWSLQTPTEREELQFDGLRESSAFVHRLLQAEIELVGAQNVVLWGLSQGCAMSLISLLLWQGPRIAAVIGMCGWLPLTKRLMDAASEETSQDPDDPFSNDADEGKRPVSDSSIFDKAVTYLRDELNLPSSNSVTMPQVPVFLGHGTEDEKVPIALGREAVELLRHLEIDVEFRDYEGLGHWYSGPMLRDIVLFIQERANWSAASSGSMQSPSKKNHSEKDTLV